MKTIISLILLLSCPVFAADTSTTITPDKPAPHGKVDSKSKKTDSFDKQDAAAFPAAGGNVFVGSSSIEKWQSMEKKFAPAPIIQRGVGGSVISEAVVYADKYVIPYVPKRIFLYSGDNDLPSKSAQYIFDQYKVFIEKVTKALPEAKIYWIGIKPSPSRAKYMDKAKQVNSLVKEYVIGKNNLACIDLWDSFLDKDGNPNSELYLKDKLHLNEAGYKIWEDAIKPLLNDS